MERRRLLAFAAAALTVIAAAEARADVPAAWRAEWPKTDFAQSLVDFDEIRSGGPPKDGIPPIDEPRFVDVAAVTDLPPTEPVIGLAIGEDARAYPLRILTWHEIVNDTVGGVPVAVTYCPLCNAAIAFDRRVDGQTLSFGTTGKLRFSDLVMYDRATESWWQQFEGRAIVGSLAGKTLRALPARLEPWSSFRERHPDGRVLVPTDPELRPYGLNPYRGYDGAAIPFLYDGSMPEGIAPMAYVVAVGDEAWSLDLLRLERRIEAGELVLSWSPGLNSALDAELIAEGRDIGYVTVQRLTDQGPVDIPYDVTFAFVFHAFRPDGHIHRP